LTLPIPPGINEQYATVNGHRVSTAVARRFKQEVKQKLATLEREGTLNDELRHRLRQGYLSLLLAFYFETPLKRDLDGGLKIAQFSRVGALSGPAHPGSTWFHCV
jgi:crossover junction endodeoxyribonuclease RusA